ncbi:MAG: hypothetical protein K5786_02935 [Treponema sp.]|nr:hypothetical protein [Treponema sp.]
MMELPLLQNAVLQKVTAIRFAVIWPGQVFQLKVIYFIIPFIKLNQNYQTKKKQKTFCFLQLKSLLSTREET